MTQEKATRGHISVLSAAIGMFPALIFVGVMLSFDPQEPPKQESPKASFVGSQKCGMCHKEIHTGMMKGPHAATFPESVPESLRGCEACHGPGSLHIAGDPKATLNPAKLKPEEADALCLKCHASGGDPAVPASWQKLTRRNWMKGLHGRKGTSCVACHSEHKGGEHQLKKEAGALCLQCHGDKKPEQGYVHTGVAGGDCLQCHDPHGTRRPQFLKDSADTTCAACHSPVDEDFAKKHAGYQLKTARCTTCHKAHMKEPGTKGISKYQHLPYAQRRCSICHEGSDVSPVPKLKKPVKDLCAGCHAAAIKEDPKKPHQHPPVKAGLCTTCHDPHGSDQSTPPLFKAETESVCLTCHSAIDSARMLSVKHQPVDSGNCIACHFGHSSKEAKLLTDVPIALCKDCHPQEHKLSHPVGYREIGGERKMVVDPRTKKMLTCASCHQVHGSQNKYLTPKDWRRELCTECHKF